MTGTTAMTTDLLTRAALGDYRAPLCPNCGGGQLHPYVVEFDLGLPAGWRGVTSLSGWVAVCRGGKAGKRFLEEDVPPCGFSMPLTPTRWQPPEPEGKRGRYTAAVEAWLGEEER